MYKGALLLTTITYLRPQLPPPSPTHSPSPAHSAPLVTTASYQSPLAPPPRMPGAVVGNATRIWELNVHWALYAQCGVWDSRGRGVDIWECIRDHDSTPGTQPPNPSYWRYIARR